MALESSSLSMPQQRSKKAKTHSVAVRFCLFALYSTIEAAASGNVDAINAVLKHYERYIAALATRTLYDENGVPHLCLDEEKVCRMRTKLITKILDFKVNKTA